MLDICNTEEVENGMAIKVETSFFFFFFPHSFITVLTYSLVFFAAAVHIIKWMVELCFQWQ